MTGAVVKWTVSIWVWLEGTKLDNISRKLEVHIIKGRREEKPLPALKNVRKGEWPERNA